MPIIVCVLAENYTNLNMHALCTSFCLLACVYRFIHMLFFHTLNCYTVVGYTKPSFPFRCSVIDVPLASSPFAGERVLPRNLLSHVLQIPSPTYFNPLSRPSGHPTGPITSLSAAGECICHHCFCISINTNIQNSSRRQCCKR